MQLLGNTEKQKQEYKQALIEAKRGGAFDLATFNSRWIEEHPEAGTAGEDENKTHVRKILDQNKNSNMCSSISTDRQTPHIERVQGDILTAEDISGSGDELREVVREIVQAIEAYKVENNIVRFSKEKNGTLLFSACLATVCDNVIKPSRILKKKPYSAIGNTTGTSNNNAYNPDVLIKFIDICFKLCGREGLCFNRTLYMSLTGLSGDYLRGNLERLTSAGVNLWQKVLDQEYTASVNFAYNSDIGNMRNLNEGEALTHRDQGAGVASVGLGELKRLGGN